MHVPAVNQIMSSSRSVGRLLKRKILIVVLALSLAGVSGVMAYCTIVPRHGTMEFPGEGTYMGQLRGLTFHGFGTWRSDLGVTYIGDFKKGSFDGHGIMIFANGSMYVGDFRNGYMHGEGRMVFADHVHEGVWEQEQFSGDHAGCGYDH